MPAPNAIVQQRMNVDISKTKKQLTGTKLRILVLCVFLTILGVIIQIYGLIFLLNYGLISAEIPYNAPWYKYIDWIIMGKIAIVLIPLCSLFYLYKRFSISEGGHAIAKALGCYRIPQDFQGVSLQSLLLINQNISKLAGIPELPIYVWDDENINAFAAGFNRKNSVVAISTGALSRLNQNEISSVLAHEYGHILCGDTKIKTNLIAVSFALLPVSIIGGIIAAFGLVLAFKKSNGKLESLGVGLGVAFLGSVVFLIGLVGFVFCIIWNSAISRQQEFRADACAAKLTGKPENLVSAFRKILEMKEAPAISSTMQRVELTYLFFHDTKFADLFHTHPSLIARIKKLTEYGKRQ